MKSFLRIGAVAFVVAFVFACSSEEGDAGESIAIDAFDPNPAAAGFDVEGSDSAAIALADMVMESMGGREAWDNTRYLTWNFFGARTLVWDKQSGDVRIEADDWKLKILMNVNTMEGRVWKDTAEVTHPDSLAPLLDLGNQVFINDSYWLVMPFKLKDSGVTLKYLGDYRIEEGEGKGAIAEVLELTFKEVGYTPQNRYRVYIPKANTQKLIYQWDFFSDNESEVRDIVTCWNDYRQYGNILLSGERGENDLTDIAVFDTLPPSVFNDFADFDLTKYE